MARKYERKEDNGSFDNFTFLLESHPKDENFFISGGGEGKIFIWDIKSSESFSQTVQSFTESGIYQRDNRIVNDIFEGKFSSCGKFFAVATV